jgi:CMP-N-acetylneuraminic acid synthetase
MKVVAVIPARAGSKGIPNKNLINIGGKPLISWSIEAAVNSAYIDKVIVTSDGDEILSTAHSFKEVDTLKRPSELAQDDTPTAPVIVHALKELKIGTDEYEYLILLQPTSPLRNHKDIDAAFDVLKNSDANALISVVKPNHHPLKSFKPNEDGYLEGLINDEYPFMPRQVLPKVYQSNGAIYIIDLKKFLQQESFFTNKTIAYEMSASKSIDLDTAEDIEKIEKQLKSTTPC